MQLLVFHLAILIAVSFVDARPSITTQDEKEISVQPQLWQPDSGTREDFFKYKGMPQEEYERKIEHLRKLQDKVKKDNNIDHSVGDIEDGCVWFTEENVDEMEREMEDESRTRYKRKLAKQNIDAKQHLRWELPIIYKFDGTHSSFQKQEIKDAIKVWETRTCVRFVEKDMKDKVDKHHLIITKKYNGCFSYVGKNYHSQLVNLGSSCLYEPGVAIHELGHTLGLWHEHQRHDREKWIKINQNNIYSFFSQFNKVDATMSHGIPYDFSSVMQYPGTAGGYGGKLVIEALNPEYQSSMGQRIALSYYDAKIINLAYCTDICKAKLSKPCSRGGYQDPNNCNKCICPDGFSGDFCEKIAPPKNAKCGGVIQLSSNGDENVVITSPDYNEKKYYDNKDECTWIIKSPEQHKVVMKFEGDFGLYAKNRETCYHFVEVKYGDNLENPGPRFCGYDTPESVFHSSTNEMVVILKAEYETRLYPTSQRRGFKAKFYAEGSQDSQSSATSTTKSTTTSITTSTIPPTTTTSSTTTSTTTATSTTTSTTTPTTTTTKKDIKWSEWSGCSRDCGCGSCSEQSRHTRCGNNRCTGSDEKIETRLCNRVCTKRDRRLLPGSTSFLIPCPRCCGTYKKKNGLCV